MDPPQFLLDALTESVTSGTFVDTKCYVFSLETCVGLTFLSAELRVDLLDICAQPVSMVLEL